MLVGGDTPFAALRGGGDGVPMLQLLDHAIDFGCGHGDRSIAEKHQPHPLDIGVGNQPIRALGFRVAQKIIFALGASDVEQTSPISAVEQPREPDDCWHGLVLCRRAPMRA